MPVPVVLRLRPTAALLAGLALAALALAARRRWGRTPGPDCELSVMTYNIHHGVGEDDRLDLRRIADEIRSGGVEVPALQEVDRHWSARSDFVDQAQWLAS
jgi:endonuclease/exonuclease/phosphatase family metal-dependent hydrolase